MSNGSIMQRVADMLALKDIVLAELKDGTRVYVESGVPAFGAAPYYLDKSSGVAEDLTTGDVVAPWAGAPSAGVADGRWILCPCGAAGPVFPLGLAGTYALLAATPSITNVLGRANTITGDVGIFPAASLVGFGGGPDGTIIGATHAGDAAAGLAQADELIARNDALSRGPATPIAADIAGAVLTPGIYHAAAALQVSGGGTVTFDAQGDPNALFIIQVESTLTMSVGSSVALANNASAKNIIWVMRTGAAVLNNSTFMGTVLANTTVSADGAGVINGRLMSYTAAITLDGNNVTVP